MQKKYQSQVLNTTLYTKTCNFLLPENNTDGVSNFAELPQIICLNLSNVKIPDAASILVVSISLQSEFPVAVNANKIRRSNIRNKNPTKSYSYSFLLDSCFFLFIKAFQVMKCHSIGGYME